MDVVAAVMVTWLELDLCWNYWCLLTCFPLLEAALGGTSPRGVIRDTSQHRSMDLLG